MTDGQQPLMPSETLSAASHFLEVVEEQQAPASYASILAAIDRLLSAYHSTPAGDPSEDDIDPPLEDYILRYRALYQTLGRRFPELGLYPSILSFDELLQQTSVNDAIDDLADLVLDMRDVVRRAEHLGLDDAHWHFRLHYIHWGEHARDLGRLLYELLTA